MRRLEAIGPYGFQQLCAAIALQAFGVNVEPLGPGRDGGRDLIHQGRLSFATANEHSAEDWDGYTVFQVKHKAQLASDPAKNAAWLWGQIRGELEAWANPYGSRDPVPDYLLFMTNVPLTPVPGSGGRDYIERQVEQWLKTLFDTSRDIGDEERRNDLLLRRLRMKRMREWKVWDGQKIDAFVTQSDAIRRAFKAFLTPGDILASLAELTDKLPLEELEEALRTHARNTLISEGLVYFDEAGAEGVSGIPIHDTVIDLPISAGTSFQAKTVIPFVLERGERVLTATAALDDGPRHIVLTGAPGNGKTTLSKFITQTYRAAFLKEAVGLTDKQRRTVENVEAALRGMNSHLPNYRRWPMRIDLAEYAEEKLAFENSTIMKWIAEKVSAKIDLGTVSARAMSSWSRQWPWALILDGLDEVSEPTMRKRLIQQIGELVEDFDGTERDILLIVTTRPMGYVEDIAPGHFQRVDLGELEAPRAVAYGVRATRARTQDDPDKVDRIEKALRRASEDEALRHLMRTPLQILIMTIIVEGAGPLAPDRFSLFWGYYETVFKRERAKSGATQRLLQDHRHVILDLHQRVGFHLQVASETATGSSAVISRNELRNQIGQALTEAGWKPNGTDGQLRDDIERAVTHRLVLLAPRGDEGYGFDVRSLQELMAARHLVTGESSQIGRRLQLTAASPHWRNTWIFAAGCVFASFQSHEHEHVLELIQGLANVRDIPFSKVFPIAPDLALDLLDDGMTRTRPVYHDRLRSLALDCLGAPCDHDGESIALILIREAEQGHARAKDIAERMRDALDGSPVARKTVAEIRDALERLKHRSRNLNRTAGLGTVKGRKPHKEDHYEATDAAWAAFEAELLQFDIEKGFAHGVVIDALRELAGRAPSEESPLMPSETLEMALAEGSTWTTLLELVLDDHGADLPELMAPLRAVITQGLRRQAVGHLLT